MLSNWLVNNHYSLKQKTHAFRREFKYDLKINLLVVFIKIHTTFKEFFKLFFFHIS